MPAPKPERTDVCIIGAGASGAAAAKVLTERGLRVVALERGPWRTKETFGGDELANVNRYNLWPDPLLNPRTYRQSADEDAAVDLFCPVPQMVGGGTVHWQGWLPRFTPEDFRLHSIVGDLPAPRWPTGRSATTTWSPTTPRWNGRSESPAWPARTPSRARAARATPARRCRCPGTRRSSTQGSAGAGLERLPDPAGRAVPPVQRPAGHGDQRLRPAARRPDRHPVQRAERLHPGRPGHRPVRPAAGKLRPGAGARRRGQDHGRGLPGRGRRDIRAGGRRLHPGLRRRRDRPADAAVEIRRASRTASPTAATSSAATSPSTSTAPRSACSTTRSTPGPAAATSARAPSSSTTTTIPAGSPAAVTSPRPGWGSRCRSTGACPDRPLWGAEAKQVDRDLQPQHGGRHGAARHAAARQPGRTRRRRSSTPGVCPSPGSPWPHTRTTSRGPVPGRPGADILEAAGATTSTGSTPSGSPATARTSTAPPGWATTRTPRCWTATAAPTRSTTCSWSTAAPFPTGTGANPTLTIMANAWRVAEHIADTRGGDARDEKGN